MAVVVTLALVAGVGALLLVERSHGAAAYGTRTYANPCTAGPDPYPGKGLDGTIQRITLSALNGAACDLGTTREELVLSLSPATGFGDKVHWDQATLQRALKKGLERSIDDAVKRGTLPKLLAAPLRFLVDKAPLDWVLGRLDLSSLEGG
jgi:hypothetical protein